MLAADVVAVTPAPGVLRFLCEARFVAALESTWLRALAAVRVTVAERGRKSCQVDFGGGGLGVAQAAISVTATSTVRMAFGLGMVRCRSGPKKKMPDKGGNRA
jgi:hypothetical protein